MALLEHDLPEYERNDSPLPIRWRAQVFKDGLVWSWVHQCGPATAEGGAMHPDWAHAFRFACEHMRGCK